MPVGLAQEAALNLNLDTKLSGDCLLLCGISFNQLMW
jgi:hypothetical protein